MDPNGRRETRAQTLARLVVLVGDSGVGKTSLTCRLLKDIFIPAYVRSPLSV